MFLKDVKNFISKYTECDDLKLPSDAILDTEHFNINSNLVKKCDWEGGGSIYGGQNLKIQSYVVVVGDVVIGNNVSIGPFSFLRGPLILGDNVKIGPYVELARSIVMDNVKISHKNVVVDSILGENSHLAGFASICNKCVGRNYINICYDGEKYKYLHKFGATIENDVSLGVNVILMPGCHVKAGVKIPGPAIVYGDGKIHR